MAESDDVPAYDPTARHWSLMTKTRKGLVSVIRELTLAEVKAMWERLDPWYGLVSYRRNNGYGRIGTDDDITLREVFGPPGWRQDQMREWQRWPRRATEEEEAAEAKRQEAYEERIKALGSTAPVSPVGPGTPPPVNATSIRQKLSGLRERLSANVGVPTAPAPYTPSRSPQE